MSVSQASPNCPACGELRTILKIRALVGAKPSEDVLTAVYRLKVWHDIYQQWIEDVSKTLGDKLPALENYYGKQATIGASGEDDCSTVRGQGVEPCARERGDGPAVCGPDEGGSNEV